MSDIIMAAASAAAGFALGRSGRSETVITRYQKYEALADEPDERLIQTDPEGYTNQWRARYDSLLQDYRRLFAIRAEQEDALNLPATLDSGITLRSTQVLTQTSLPYRLTDSGLICHFADVHPAQAADDMFVRCGDQQAVAITSTTSRIEYEFPTLRPALFLGLLKTPCTQRFRLRGGVVVTSGSSSGHGQYLALGEAWQRIRPTTDIANLGTSGDNSFPLPPGRTAADYTRVGLGSVHVMCSIIAPDAIELAVSPLDQAVFTAAKTPYIAFSLASTSVISRLSLMGASRYVDLAEQPLKFQNASSALGLATAAGTEPRVFISATSTYAGTRALALPNPRQIDVKVHVAADKTTGLLV